jgi:hypothetical protein
MPKGFDDRILPFLLCTAKITKAFFTGFSYGNATNFDKILALSA